MDVSQQSAPLHDAVLSMGIEEIRMNNFSMEQFEAFRGFIHKNLGIHLGDEKKDTLKIKLMKQMARNNIDSFDDYFDVLNKRRDKDIYTGFINEITTNKTEFFRENTHFDFLRDEQKMIFSNNPRVQKSKQIRVWSAACSTGEEPYTLAITLLECMSFIESKNIRILATDINNEVLSKALRGYYGRDIEKDISKLYLLKYFQKEGFGYRVKDSVQDMVTFRLFNLMNPFPFKNQFDIIFCRNVMIYFNKETQERLVNKFYDVLVPGGLFIVGLSETLNGKTHRFKYVKPTIYIK